MTAEITFVDRHCGPSEHQRDVLARQLGFDCAESLVAAAIPSGVQMAEPLTLPAGLGESEALAQLQILADQTSPGIPMVGLGYYGTHTPGVIRRNVLQDPSWYTAYTPYQPEISQGRLEALLNFQTMVCDLTGLSTAGASLLDEASAAAETITLMRRVSKTPTDAVVLVDAQIFPQSLAVMLTRARPLGVEVVVAELTTAPAVSLAASGRPVLGVVLQYPGADGVVRDLEPVVGAAQELGALVAVAADLLALTLLRPPGEFGADIAFGTTQRFGVPLSAGGPHAGYLAVRGGLERALPGRLVGVSQDTEGNRALRLSLQTREQHIRREKATSNICTAQVLLAVLASMYAVYHGPAGLRAIAHRVATTAATMAAQLRALGLTVVHDHFFDTVLVRLPGQAASLVAAADAREVLLRFVDADHVALAVDETTTPVHLELVRQACAEVLRHPDADARVATGSDHAQTALPSGLRRTSEYLTHPVFSSYHSETQLLRYLKFLADQDYALDRGMIPLGSCTMKLNATTEMEPVTWPQWGNLHPFAPAARTAGIRQLVGQLETWLADITGYDAVSVHPNAGSQGELAGLLAIRAYHQSRGAHERTVCLIPSSAHGTNAASAALAGMQVAVVACDDRGNIDLSSVREVLAKHEGTVAAIMVTYPSTHGVYEDTLTQICELVHTAGGQVYVDGANLNALVGWVHLGKVGADVSHVNLHKTFAIPHGGGGPGVGPVAVKSHLAAFMPAHPWTGEQWLDADLAAVGKVGPVSAAPWGSAGILPISWAYIALMGAHGLRAATTTAVVSANYIAYRLREHYPILYTGTRGLVAHECIVDLRPLREATGITVDDVAKRLIDYGFHAPTMSFPVAGTLMVEPTESEDVAELDRFCDAMIAIKAEADAVAGGLWPADDNPLVNAPHTAACLVAEWTHAYSREQAVYPAGVDPRRKYWPPVRRIDGAFGDRNLLCTCPMPSELAESPG